MMKDFEQYDHTKKYFGPQGSPLSQYIHIGVEIMPINIDLRDSFDHMLNVAGYEHDKEYHGTRRGGFSGTWIDEFSGTWIDELARRRADKRLRNTIKEWAEEHKDWMNKLEYKAVHLFAKTTYHAIRRCGFIFFRTGE